MADNRTEKEVLIRVKSDTTETNKNLDGLKQKIKDTSDIAKEMGRLDYGKLSVKELREELDKAETSMNALERSGNGTDATFKLIGERVDTINENLNRIKTNDAYEKIRGGIRGITGAVLATEGAMATLGLESKEFEKTVQTIIGIRAFRRGLDDLIKYREEMLTMIGVTKGATSATRLLRIGLSGLGIGLLVSAVAYLVEYWDDFKESVYDIVPPLRDVGEWFEKIRESGGSFKAVFTGVGKAVVDFVLTPLKGVVDVIRNLLDGDFKEAGKSYLETMNSIVNPVAIYKNAVNSYKEGYSKQIKREDDKRMAEALANIKDVELKKTKEAKKGAKDRSNIRDKEAEEEKRLLDQLNKYITDAERKIYEDRTEARVVEIEDVERKYEKQLELAKRFNRDTIEIEEAYRLELDAVIKKWDEKELEDARKFEEEKEKAKLEARKNALERTSMTGETNVIEEELRDDGTPESLRRITDARLLALTERFEVERLLYEEDEIKLTNLRARFEQERTSIEDNYSKQREEIAKRERDAKLNTYSEIGGAIGALGQLAGEQTVANKALGVASATIDTFVGANKALAQGGILGIVGATKVIATGLANVKSILSTKVKAKGVSASSTRGVTSNTQRTAPVINTTVLNRPEIEDLNSLGATDSNNNREQPIRAYIVDRDLKENADKDNLIEQLSTF